MKLDYLVDYYQSGLSLQVEAILRGNGYLKTFPLDSALTKSFSPFFLAFSTIAIFII